MTDYTPLAQMMGLDDKTADEMRTAWAALNIEWHCQGRHGVIRDVPAADAGRVNRVIEWHMGHNAARWAATKSGKRDVEFVPMTKTIPAPKKPWEWCGTTVLFTDWQERERATAEAVQSFNPGEPVWFEHKGSRLEGFVTKVNRKTVGVLIPNDGEWRVSPTLLNRKA